MSDRKVVVHPGFCMILFIVFLILKLTNTIDWSWWWVSAPLWIPFCIILLALVILGIITILNEM